MNIEIGEVLDDQTIEECGGCGEPVIACEALYLRGQFYCEHCEPEDGSDWRYL